MNLYNYETLLHVPVSSGSLVEMMSPINRTINQSVGFQYQPYAIQQLSTHHQSVVNNQYQLDGAVYENSHKFDNQGYQIYEKIQYSVLGNDIFPETYSERFNIYYSKFDHFTSEMLPVNRYLSDIKLAETEYLRLLPFNKVQYFDSSLGRIQLFHLSMTRLWVDTNFNERGTTQPSNFEWIKQRLLQI